MYDRVRSFFIATCVIIIFTSILDQLVLCNPLAYAHFIRGTAINLSNGYQIRFVPSSPVPAVGDKTTHLNFSILKNNSDIYEIYVSLQVKKSGTGESVVNIPYRPYVFSDVSIPLIFNDSGNYNVTFDTLIPEDQVYRSIPLQASFNLQVVSPLQAMFLDTRVLFAVIVAPIAAGAAIVPVYDWKRD